MYCRCITQNVEFLQKHAKIQGSCAEGESPSKKRLQLRPTLKEKANLCALRPEPIPAEVEARADRVVQGAHQTRRRVDTELHLPEPQGQQVP